ncbi:4Fe-4S dicluster domain-containing protein [Desulfonatronum thiodismutans]|uniref:4Fe-4S dicluster domain-containing protein n=1 Tax=Desulfonatronum thiodismutans TaxID=159290 RepID=UPI00068A1DF7|nr:4Fe-4S dicluster domain-containing protein [Desulfonatronum thiodismutans]
MKKYAMVVDSSVCIDCKGCMVSCKVQNNVPKGYWRNWIKHTTPDFSLGKLTRTHFQPGGCMQCDVPTCVTACPSGATFKDRETGIVHVNESLCIGCGNCVRACPYGARFRHPEKRVPDKCDFCFSAGRLARGIPPACVDTCPTKARVFGDLNDPDSEVSRLLREKPTVRVTSKSIDTQPNLYYVTATEPANWVGDVEFPEAYSVMASLVNPLVKVAVGLSALGVAGMWAKQAFAPDPPDPEDDEHGPEAKHPEPTASKQD